MPHFITSDTSLRLESMPFNKEEFSFIDVLKSKNGDRAILISQGSFDMSKLQNVFCVMAQKHPKGLIYKGLKLTRPSLVGVLKSALRILKDTQSHILTHNLDNDKPSQRQNQEYLKNELNDLDREFVLEIGFGSGRNLLALAKDAKSILHIGVEIHTPSIQQVLRQIDLLKLDNLYILNTDARNLISTLPSNKCLGAYLHFPIPFNEHPHRRVISKEFFENILRILRHDCTLHIRSDDEIYIKDSINMILDIDIVKMEVRKNIEFDITSKYEARWERQGKNIYDLLLGKTKSGDLDILHKKSNISFENLSLAKIDELSKTRIIEENIILVIDHIFKSEKFVMFSVCMGDIKYPSNKVFLVDLSRMVGGFVGGDPIKSEGILKASMRLKEILA